VPHPGENPHPPSSTVVILEEEKKAKSVARTAITKL